MGVFLGNMLIGIAFRAICPQRVTIVGSAGIRWSHHPKTQHLFALIDGLTATFRDSYYLSWHTATCHDILSLVMIRSPDVDRHSRLLRPIGSGLTTRISFFFPVLRFTIYTLLSPIANLGTRRLTKAQILDALTRIYWSRSISK